MADLPDWYTQVQGVALEATSFRSGADASKPAAPAAGEIWYATDSKILYICATAGTWTGFDAAILVEGVLTLYADVVGGGYEITNLKDPTAAQSAATRAYALAQIAVHAALTATHGVGGTIAGLADIVTYVATHAALTATHGKLILAGMEDITTVPYALASDTLINSNDTERSKPYSATYIKIKESRLDLIGPSTMRIKFDLKSSQAGWAVLGKLYRNGVAIGTERSNDTTSYVTYAEDFDVSAWAATDLIQVYVKTAYAATMWAQNLRLCYTFSWRTTNQDP